MPVARLPGLDQDEDHRMVQMIPMAGVSMRFSPARVVEEENVTEEIKEEYGAWLKARIMATKYSAGGIRLIKYSHCQKANSYSQFDRQHLSDGSVEASVPRRLLGLAVDPRNRARVIN